MLLKRPFTGCSDENAGNDQCHYYFNGYGNVVQRKKGTFKKMNE